jgi:hypothetical protein
MSGDLAALIREMPLVTEHSGYVRKMRPDEAATWLSARGVVVLDREQVARTSDGPTFCGKWTQHGPHGTCEGATAKLPPAQQPSADEGPRCWRGECRERCYYPETCSEVQP